MKLTASARFPEGPEANFPPSHPSHRLSAKYGSLLLDRIVILCAMARPETPSELQDHIVNLLEDGQEGLCEASAASHRLNIVARRILFRTVEADSIDRLIRLYHLLENRQCTVPVTIDHLTIQCEHPQMGRHIPHDSPTFSDAFGVVLDYFQVQVSISLNLPWVLSRHRDLVDLQDHPQLRKLVLRGCYHRTNAITDLLAYLPNLEVLVVDASFKSTWGDGRVFEGVFGLKSNDFLSPVLKELVLSPEALALMPWMCLLGAGKRPTNLHLIRLKIDDIRHTHAIYRDIENFFKIYGSTMVHVYLWFEETWDALYDAFGEGLTHAPNLKQLELMLPSAFDEEEAEGFADGVLSRLPESTNTRVRAGNAIGLDEREFWEAPSPCTGETSGFVCGAVDVL
ncbi:hypothetical protein NMY22_g17691 [Coprinellus aureogranulatus]|nr:hypothetical protein NMY22_g17691 [Coprinellus aureogranulatus]